MLGYEQQKQDKQKYQSFVFAAVEIILTLFICQIFQIIPVQISLHTKQI